MSACAIEDGRKARKLVERGVAPRDRIMIDAIERDHEIPKETSVLSRDGGLMAEQRAAILIGSSDDVAQAEDFYRRQA